VESTGQRERHDWIDFVKAISILLVVLLHQLQALDKTELIHAPSVAVWVEVNDFLTPVRMPLFFLASGILASSSLKRGRSRAFRDNIYSRAYLYCVWAAIFALAMPFVPGWPLILPPTDKGVLMLLLVLTGTSLAWYLWALPVAFYVGWATRNVTPRKLIAASFLLSALPLEHSFSGHLMRCLLFFLAGLRIPDFVAKIESLANARRLVLSVLAFAVLSFARPEIKVYIRPFVELAGVSCAVFCCVILGRASSAVASAARWLGRRTLQIYLLHFPIVNLLALAIPQLLTNRLMDERAFASVFPLMAVAIAVAASLLTHTLLKAMGASWLFALPDWMGSRTLQRDTRSRLAAPPPQISSL